VRSGIRWIIVFFLTVPIWEALQEASFRRISGQFGIPISSYVAGLPFGMRAIGLAPLADASRD